MLFASFRTLHAAMDPDPHKDEAGSEEEREREVYATIDDWREGDELEEVPTSRDDGENTTAMDDDGGARPVPSTQKKKAQQNAVEKAWPCGFCKVVYGRQSLRRHLLSAKRHPAAEARALVKEPELLTQAFSRAIEVLFSPFPYHPFVEGMTRSFPAIPEIFFQAFWDGVRPTLGRLFTSLGLDANLLLPPEYDPSLVAILSPTDVMVALETVDADAHCRAVFENETLNDAMMESSSLETSDAVADRDDSMQSTSLVGSGDFGNDAPGRVVLEGEVRSETN